jgi:hypothetical protein
MSGRERHSDEAENLQGNQVRRPHVSAGKRIEQQFGTIPFLVHHRLFGAGESPSLSSDKLYVYA